MFVLQIVLENIGKNRKKNINSVEQGVVYPLFLLSDFLMRWWKKLVCISSILKFGIMDTYQSREFLKQFLSSSFTWRLPAENHHQSCV